MTHSTRSIDQEIHATMRGRLQTLYGDRAETCLARIMQLVEDYVPRLPKRTEAKWDQRDIVLITYGDQLHCADQTPLKTLYDFLVEHELEEVIGTVHVLPFSPYSSDDGFSVIDYRTVDPDLGSWDDIRELDQRFSLMFDLVLNHTSSQSRWFQEYLAGNEPYTGYFIELDPSTDVSAVTRPRSSPVLSEVETNRGQRHVWTTFSADQVDLNFANPDVLVEMIDIFLSYIEHGARIIRLDAIAYLWKQVGTDCIHLPQTHEVVKLMRDLLNAVAPHVLLLTETNVPHAENISYFGNGDEAQMVYQFSLPPLLLDAMISHDARPLVQWLSDLHPAPAGSTFFNFTASHDGVGVRPLEGLVSADRISDLVDGIRAQGGLVSNRRQPDGTDVPYELNVSYVSAVGEPSDALEPDSGITTELHARRFLTSQGLMLSLRGMPAIYFHSLVGTTNDHEGVERSGQPRRINRRKFEIQELTEQLADRDSLQARIFTGYRHLLRVRIEQPAFHPEGQQDVWQVEENWLIAILRTSIDQKQRILVMANLSDEPHEIDLSRHSELQFGNDLLSGKCVDSAQKVELEPGELVWLEAKS
jgi:glycosidase